MSALVAQPNARLGRDAPLAGTGASARAVDGPSAHRHLIATGWALLVILGIVLIGLRIADRLQDRALDGLAPRILPQKYLGQSLQAEAFGRSDMLVIYGSSELMNVEQPYHANRLFEDHPRGFTPFIVGRDGTTSLNFLQQIASLGPSLRGKRVVLSYTPGMFFRDLINPEFYAGSFSPLHAYAVVFGVGLAPDVKQAIAAQMLKYPDTLADDPLLRFALERVVGGSALDQALYSLVRPAGIVKLWLLQLQDRLSVLGLILRHPSKATAPEDKRPINWTTLRADADEAAHAASTNNPFGVTDDFWIREYNNLLNARWNDGAFLTELEAANAWTDLALTLRVLRQHDAHVLVLVMPMHGFYYEYMGVSKDARQAYYRKLEDVTRAADVPVLSFEEHDADRFFLTDPHGHLSPKGWVEYAQALDAFYHQER
jgi:D-alanine transfer protein